MEKRLYELTNGEITIAVSNCGAELHSVQKDGAEYLWQAGVPGLWKRHSPVLFPFVGRFTDGKYKLHGKEYPMTIHGFCQEAMFDMVSREENRLVFELTDTDETYAVYPFHFEFLVAYELRGSSIAITYRVQNFSEEVMYFGLGAHPGFKVPLEEGLAFEDYYLEFKDVCEPDRVIFSANALVDTPRPHYPLEGGKRIPLHHDLFDDDAVVLEHMGDEMRLASDRGTRSLTFRFPQMPYLGLWHTVKTEAPFLCVEPWVTLPSREGIVEDFACRSDLIRLPADEAYCNTWSISLT